jgi:hypothetical protein
MPPDMKRGDPQAARPGDRRQNITAATARQQRLSGANIRRGRRKRRYPLASASLYAPANARTWWWISLRCPCCKAVHLHRVRREQDAGGVRRTGCGRLVFVRIRTVYRGAVPASAEGRLAA